MISLVFPAITGSFYILVGLFFSFALICDYASNGYHLLFSHIIKQGIANYAAAYAFFTYFANGIFGVTGYPAVFLAVVITSWPAMSLMNFVWEKLKLRW